MDERSRAVEALSDELPRPTFPADLAIPRGLADGQAPVGQRDPAFLSDEAPRTVARAHCKIDAFFGLVTLDATGQVTDKLRFSQVQPELTITSNGSIAVKIGVTNVGDFPGALSIQIDRDPGGNVASLSFPANDAATLEAALQNQKAVAVAAPGVTAAEPLAKETISARVTWTPQNAPACTITPPEALNLVWNYAPRGAQFQWSAHAPLTKPGKKTGVATGTTVGRRQLADGAVLDGVPTQVFFAVKDLTSCCGGQTGRAVIQFVRHSYRYNGQPPHKPYKGPWSLDVLDGETARARAGQDYDPTFTHDPRGTDPAADPLVYPGPNPDGAPSIVQVDRPAIPDALYAKFLQGGGVFTWDLCSLLMCALVPAANTNPAKDYLTNGKVEQLVVYRLELVFPGGGDAPTVSPSLQTVETYAPKCKPLGDVLKAASADHINLRKAYDEPAGHQVPF